MILSLITKSRRSYRELCQDMLGICQNEVPEFDGDIFKSIGVVFQSINPFLSQSIGFYTKHLTCPRRVNKS